MHYRAFAWQNGYGVFSVSQSIVDKTLDYISNQEMHHKRFSFQDEYRQFLLSYGVEYDEAYVLIKAFALTGRGDSTMWKTQGVASLALGYVLHWAFSPSLLNPKPQGVASLALGMCSIGLLLTSSAAAQQFKQA